MSTLTSVADASVTPVESVAYIKAADSDEWEPYTPNSKIVFVISPGAALRKHAYLYKDLEAQGYEVVSAFDSSYEYYPPGTDVLRPLGIRSCVRMPDMKRNRDKNLATFVDDVVVPKIRELVAEGRGPAAVWAACRGGIICMPRLWEIGWRGPSIVGNGGFVGTAAIPSLVSACVLVTAGWEPFVTRTPESTARFLERDDTSTPVFVYHDPKESHDLNRLTGISLAKLVDLAVTRNLEASGTWPQGIDVRQL